MHVFVTPKFLYHFCKLHFVMSEIWSDFNFGLASLQFWYLHWPLRNYVTSQYTVRCSSKIQVLQATHVQLVVFLDSTGETAPRQRFNPSTASRVDTSTRQLRGSNIALDMPNIGNTTSPRPYLSQQVRKLGQQFNVLISKNYAQLRIKRVLCFHEFFLVL